MARQVLFSLASNEASPATASATAVSAKMIEGLEDFGVIEAVATIIGPPDRAIDVYLQGSYDGVSWHDWVHFPQVAAAATKTYKAVAHLSSTITEIGNGTVGTPAVTIAANSIVPGHPGRYLRAVYVTGSGGVGSSSNQNIKIVGTFAKS